MSTVNILPQVTEKLHEGGEVTSSVAARPGSRGTVWRYVHLYRSTRARSLTVGISTYPDAISGRGESRSRVYHNVTKSSQRRLEALLRAYPGRVSVTLSGDGPRVMLALVSRAKDGRHE